MRAQCGRSATILATLRTGDPYFVILGASLLPLAWVLMLLPHGGYGIFSFSHTSTHFHPFSHFFLLIFTMDSHTLVWALDLG